MKWLLYPALVILAIGTTFANIEAFIEADPRLEEKVTIEENHVKLEEIVQSLAEQSGVDIKAGTGRRDWRVRERKVTIHAKEMPLGQMLDEIRRVTGFHLSREGKEGEWSYVIWQDLKGRRFEEEMLIAAKEAQAQRVMDIRQDMLDAAEDALNMTPEEALKLKDENPLAAYMGGTKPGRGFAQILSSLESVFPNEYGLMMRGKKVTIPYSSFPTWLQGAAEDILGGGLLAWIGGRAELLGNVQFAPHELVFEAPSGPDRNMQEAIGLAGVIFMNAQMSGEHTGTVPAGIFAMSSPNSLVGNLFGEFLLAIEEGDDPDGASRRINEKAEEEILDLIARKSPTEEDPPTDPELLREIEILRVMAETSSEVLADRSQEGEMMAEVARAAEISVLLESYASTLPVGAFIKEGKQPFYNILIAVEKAGCTWELGDGTLRIRPEDWAIHRSYEIPESFLNYYKALIERTGEITLDDLAAIAIGLTDSQTEGGLRADRELGPILSAVIDNKGRRDVLRAYGLMDVLQKDALHADEGLPFAYLTDQQWGYLEEIITDRLGGVHIVDGYMRIVQREEEGQRPDTEIFELMVFTPNDEEPRSVKTWVNVPTKAHIERALERRRQIEEAMEKAQEERAD